MVPNVTPNLVRIPVVSRGDAFNVWLRVALQSFGGPAGQIAVLHRLIVDEKRWLSEQRFLHALSYCMLLPGPEAQQLATYVGWLLGGVRGGLVAGCLFIAPGFLTILALSLLYAGYHDVGVVAGVFYGLKPAVLAVVLEALVRLRRRALTERAAVGIALGAFVAIFVFRLPFPLIVLLAALAGVAAWRRGESGTSDPTDIESALNVRPSFLTAFGTMCIWLTVWIAPLVALAAIMGPRHILVREGVFFSKAAVVTFGGAYSVLSYVAQQAVETYHWLTPQQMLDGLGMAETTPGPLIQVVQFVGFMGAYANPGRLTPVTAGILGSIVTTWVTFVPSFLFIFVGAPFVEYLRRNRTLTAALRGITACVVGVVLNLAIWFALHTLFGDVRPLEYGPFHLVVPTLRSVDWGACAIAAAAMLAIFRWRVGMLTTLGVAAIVGVLLRL